MSTLKTIEKEAFEDLLGMGGGYVLDFTNQTFAGFFREAAGVLIYDDRYAVYGDSKAKRMRAFWEKESDQLVGKVLSELIDIWAYKTPQPDEVSAARSKRCRAIAARLLSGSAKEQDPESAFLDLDLSAASLSRVRIDQSLLTILEARFAEAKNCFQAKAWLATIFHCGSILEGLLLGVAWINPRQFNQCPSSPKDRVGKVKQFQERKLAELIDVACDAGHLKLDIRKFSHALRDFRNYIHPHQQLSTGFCPDRHTAEICLQVLKAAVASLSGDRGK